MVAAVTAAVRHKHTDYDALPADGLDRTPARQSGVLADLLQVGQRGQHQALSFDPRSGLERVFGVFHQYKLPDSQGRNCCGPRPLAGDPGYLGYGFSPRQARSVTGSMLTLNLVQP